MTPNEQAGMLPSADWMSSRWRPMMGWMYMTVCIFDFIIFPVLWTLVQIYDPQGQVTAEWTPLTLKGGGLFHMAMGAVLGVAAWSRGQEKITAMNQSSNTNYSTYRDSNNSYAYPTRQRVPQPPAPEL